MRQHHRDSDACVCDIRTLDILYECQHKKLDGERDTVGCTSVPVSVQRSSQCAAQQSECSADGGIDYPY